MFKTVKFFLFVIAWIGGVMNGNCTDIKNMQDIKFEFDGEVTQSYTTATNANDIRDFVSDCIDAKKIYINSIENTSKPRDVAMQTLLLNVVNSTVTEKITSLNQLKITLLSDDIKAKVALIAWIGYHNFSCVSPDTSGICFHILNEIAPTNYDKALWVLKSQCQDDKYSPKDDGDWGIIGNAIHLLKNEKNGHTTEAVRLLSTLRSSGKYTALLGK